MESNTTSDEMQLEKAKSVVPLNTWILISNLKLAYNITRQPDGSFNRHLAEFLDRKVAANISPVDGVFTMDVNIDRNTGLWIRIFTPLLPELHSAQQRTKIPVFVYFHGGSFVHSCANSAIYDAVGRSFAKLCRAVVVSVNFRRSPEHRYPVAYEDGFAALKWMQTQALIGSSAWLPSCADLSRCFLIGDSSGGNIVHHVGVMAANADLGPLCIAGHILLMPMFGGMKRTPAELRLDGQYFVTIKDRDFYWQSFLPPGADRDHPACNIFGPYSNDLSGVPLPPSLVMIADLDLVQDWQREYVRGLRERGKYVELVELEQATVGFFLFPNTEHFRKVITEICSFINRAPSICF